LALAALVLLWTSAAAPHAQSPDLQTLLDKATSQVVDFVARFSNVVAEEIYLQETTEPRKKRTLRSDLALVLYPGATQWLVFRDVYEVDGKSVRGEAEQERIMRLFLEPPRDAVRRAAEITRAGSGYNLEDVGTINNPLLAIALLQPQYRTHFRFNLAGLEKDLGPRVRTVRFVEYQRPTILRADPNNDLPVQGFFWIDEPTGHVVKTELKVGMYRIPPEVVTLFRFDEELGLNVPAEMRDRYPLRSLIARIPGQSRLDSGGELRGVATYGKFRRFQVRTESTIQP
jgi:SHS2 domain-containing protein